KEAAPAKPARPLGSASQATPQRSTAFNPRAADDRVAAVGEADPRLALAVVVRRPDDEGRVLAADPDALGALGIQAAPDPDERVVLPLAADRRLVRVPGQDARVVGKLHEHVHHGATNL